MRLNSAAMEHQRLTIGIEPLPTEVGLGALAAILSTAEPHVALAYGAATLLVAPAGQWLDRELPWLQMGAGALCSAACSVAACVVVGLSFGAVGKILLLAFFSAIIAPFVFLAADFALADDYDPD